MDIRTRVSLVCLDVHKCLVHIEVKARHVEMTVQRKSVLEVPARSMSFGVIGRNCPKGVKNLTASRGDPAEPLTALFMSNFSSFDLNHRACSPCFADLLLLLFCLNLSPLHF